MRFRKQHLFCNLDVYFSSLLGSTFRLVIHILQSFRIYIILCACNKSKKGEILNCDHLSGKACIQMCCIGMLILIEFQITVTNGNLTYKKNGVRFFFSTMALTLFQFWNCWMSLKLRTHLYIFVVHSQIRDGWRTFLSEF